MWIRHRHPPYLKQVIINQFICCVNFLICFLLLYPDRYSGYGFEGRIPPQLLAYLIKYEIRKLKASFEDHLEYQKQYDDARVERAKEAARYKLGTISKREDEPLVGTSNRLKTPQKPTSQKEVIRELDYTKKYVIGSLKSS